MKASCLECHNTHEDSPKKDWKVGDVRGVLELVRPLDRDIARTQSGLRGAFVLMGAVSALTLTLGAVWLMRRRQGGRWTG